MGDLVKKVLEYNLETKEALSLIWDDLNPGQQKQRLKNPSVKALLLRYGIIKE